MIIYLFGVFVPMIIYYVAFFRMRRGYKKMYTQQVVREQVLFMILATVGRAGAFRCRECYVELNVSTGMWIVPISQHQCDFYCMTHKPDANSEVILDG